MPSHPLPFGRRSSPVSPTSGFTAGFTAGYSAAPGYAGQSLRTRKIEHESPPELRRTSAINPRRLLHDIESAGQVLPAGDVTARLIAQQAGYPVASIMWVLRLLVNHHVIVALAPVTYDTPLRLACNPEFACLLAELNGIELDLPLSC